MNPCRKFNLTLTPRDSVRASTGGFPSSSHVQIPFDTGVRSSVGGECYEELMAVSQLSLDFHPVIYLGEAPLFPFIGIYSAYRRRNTYYDIILQGEIQRWGL